MGDGRIEQSRPDQPARAGSDRAGPAQAVSAQAVSARAVAIQAGSAGAGGPMALLSAGNAAVSRLLATSGGTSAPGRPGTPGVPLQRQSATIAAPPERLPGPNDPLVGTTTGDLTPPAARPMIALGSHSQAVADLQVRLNEDGAQPRLTPSGTFDQPTDRAVRAFQRRHGLLVDGIVGPQTWGLLDETSRADILGAHDVLAGTHAVSDAEAAAVGSHMSTTPAAPGHLTGGGNGGAYEQEVFAALDTYYAGQLAQVVTPTATIGDAQTIGRIAQRLVDDFYSDHIVMASRPPGLDQYHPGSYRMPVADAATRQVDPSFASLWVQQDIEFAHGTSASGVQPADVSEAHQVDTRRPPDAAEVRRVADKYLQSGRLATVVRYIRAYPAEASEAGASTTGRVFVGLGDPSFQGRQGRWDLLSGLMHEYLHIAAHPHFTDAAERMGGAARRVLIEGMCDYFRVEAWNAIAPRFSTDAGLRQAVEGSFFTPVADTSAIVPHSTYDEIADARGIVAGLDRPAPGGGPIPLGSAGGEANARAAYFLGHVDLLGIGPTTTGDAPAGNLGTRGAADDTDAHVYVVPPSGETLGRVVTRAGTTAVFTEDGLGLVDQSQQLAAGTRLRIDGIRFVRTVEHDTRAQVAAQNGVGLGQLEVANRMAPAPGDAPIPVGTRILIPSH